MKVYDAPLLSTLACPVEKGDMGTASGVKSAATITISGTKCKNRNSLPAS